MSITIHLHSKRKRLVDPDGLSGKAAIDGLVKSKVLEDDSHKQVKEVTFSQEKVGRKEQEKTVITLTWEDDVPLEVLFNRLVWEQKNRKERK